MTVTPPPPLLASTAVLSLGRIDIHSHILPGIDDGCETFADVVASIRRLKQAGYVGSICTPHIQPEHFPGNTPEHIALWIASLREQLAAAGIDYTLWQGGELQLFDGVEDTLMRIGVPTLAGSRYVLMDFWEKKWPKWVDRAADWLLERDYQPILAHPERIVEQPNLIEHIEALVGRGVVLQGNFRCMTGHEGPFANRLVRHFLDAGQYAFLAIDMHRPADLEARMDGLKLVQQEYGSDLLDKMTINQPRQLILGEAAT